ncbi:MAG: diflavin oxidoreductase [Verrucomicrobiales bacterium]
MPKTSALSNAPVIPSSAPFSAEQRAWLNGFLAALFSAEQSGASNGASAGPISRKPLLILFGSQSGNAEGVAKKLARSAGVRGFAARAAGMETVEPAALEKETNLLVITSTWGEGEVPDNAAALWQGLNQNGASPNLTSLSYAVLALGDRNYTETFCLAGRRFDERLAELGAKRIADRVDCDVDFDESAAQWSESVFEALGATPPLPASGAVTEDGAADLPEIGTAPASDPASVFSKANPFPARLLTNRRLNREGSAKETRHIEFSIQGSGLAYEAGDALGVCPVNCPEVVARVIEAHQLDPEAAVALPDGREAPLREALERHFEMRQLLGKSGETASPREFVAGLRRLQPRLYSIASSPRAHPGEVHLCVGVVRYYQNEQPHKGVASTFLADRLANGETAPVFIHCSPHFRLPADSETPIVMVGPGTGIAPFRAFLEDRALTAARGRNWLFFGDQHAATDFLYRDELEHFLRRGVLHRLDAAFSRDQPRKIYVQHRMLACAMELWRWLQEGAFLYVCGDASRMAKDVDATLNHIARVIGGLNAAAAAAYVAEMKRSKRYLRDVY